MSDRIDDNRLATLLDLLKHREPGVFCNYALLVQEVRSLIAEVRRSRAVEAAQ